MYKIRQNQYLLTIKIQVIICQSSAMQVNFALWIRDMSQVECLFQKLTSLRESTGLLTLRFKFLDCVTLTNQTRKIIFVPCDKYKNSVNTNLQTQIYNQNSMGSYASALTSNETREIRRESNKEECNDWFSRNC